MRQTTVFSGVIALLLTAGAAALPSGAVAQITTLKMTTLDRENEVTSQPLIWWMKTIEERTQGRVKFQPYWSQSLVPAPRTMSAVKSGIADVGYLVSALLSSEERDFAPLDIDGALPTDQSFIPAWKAIEPTINKILDKHGLVMMWPRRSPKVVLSCKHKFLTKAADYAGTKVRSAGRWESLAVSRWGATVFAIPPSDIYTALQSGTVDCAYLVYPVVWALKIYEVAPYVTQLEDSAAFTFMAMNKARWNKLSDQDRKTIRAISEEAMQREVDVVGKRELGIIEDMKKAGAKFYKPDPAERRRLVESIKPLWAEVRKSVGPNGLELANILEKSQQSH